MSDESADLEITAVDALLAPFRATVDGYRCLPDAALRIYRSAFPALKFTARFLAMVFALFVFPFWPFFALVFGVQGTALGVAVVWTVFVSLPTAVAVWMEGHDE